MLAPWHIRSEKSMDFANGCAKEPAQAQDHIYNHIRPPEALGMQTPQAYYERITTYLPVCTAGSELVQPVALVLF